MVPLPDEIHYPRIAIPRNERIDKIPLIETHRKVLCAVYDAIMDMFYQKEIQRSIGAPLSLVIQMWIEKYGPDFPTEDFDHDLEQLSRWDLISIADKNDWNDKDSIQVSLFPDGFHAGIGELRKDLAGQIIKATNILIKTVDKHAMERDTSNIDENEVLTVLGTEWPDVPSDVIRQSIYWLVHGQIIRIEEPGPNRGRWWVRLGLVHQITDAQIRQPSVDQDASGEYIFTGSAEEWMRVFKEQKDWHEQEMKLIEEVISRLQVLMKEAGEKGEDDLRQEFLGWLSRALKLDTAYDLIVLLQKVLRKHPEWKTLIVPESLKQITGNSEKQPELPPVRRL